MDVLVLTVLLSLLLVAIFLVFYLKERGRRGFGSVEQDALLPFSDEGRRVEKRGPDRKP